jgi:competence ComEA-like helix-hairpin-helix protein
MMTNKYFSKIINFRTLTCLCILGCFLLALGSTGWAEEKEVLKGNTVNINTGTFEELAQVPLMTEQMATDIVEYREENGDFQVIEELLQIDGFTRKLLRRLKAFLLLEGLGGDDCTC